MNAYNEYQSELFDEFSKSSKQGRFKRPAEKQKQVTLTISREKLIFSIIFVILLYIIFFSLGIERGKKIALISIKQNSYSTKAVTKTSSADTQSQQPPAKEQKAGLSEDKTSNLEVATRVIETKKAIPELKEFYSIQAVAYSNISRAEKEARKVRSRGNEAIIDSSGKYHLLLIGKFKNKKDAVALRKKLTSTYKGCYVRKYKIED